MRPVCVDNFTDKSDNTISHVAQLCINTHSVSTVVKAGSVADSEASVKCRQYPKVQDKLKECARFWRGTLDAPPFVWQIVTESYRLPFIHPPTPAQICNSTSARQDPVFVTNCIDDLLANGCVAEVKDIPLVCSPLSVVTSARGKKRLVIDLRHINLYL